jgi:hypothetical protein
VDDYKTLIPRSANCYCAPYAKSLRLMPTPEQSAREKVKKRADSLLLNNDCGF